MNSILFWPGIIQMICSVIRPSKTTEKLNFGYQQMTCLCTAAVLLAAEPEYPQGSLREQLEEFSFLQKPRTVSGIISHGDRDTAVSQEHGTCCCVNCFP